MSEPTKDERLIARLGLISSLQQQGEISAEQAARLTAGNMAEYQAEETPVETLRRVFGWWMKGDEKK